MNINQKFHIEKNEHAALHNRFSVGGLLGNSTFTQCMIKPLV